MRADEWLLESQPRVARLSHVLFSFWVVFIAAGVAHPLVEVQPPDPDASMPLWTALLLIAGLVAMCSSLALMVFASCKVFGARHVLDDWRSLLLLSWLLPYIGLPATLAYRRLKQLQAASRHSGA